jgi:hypothetical protein
MIARRESLMVLSVNERTLEILFPILELRINDICSSSISGWVSGDCVIIFCFPYLSDSKNYFGFKKSIKTMFYWIFFQFVVSLFKKVVLPTDNLKIGV